MPEEKEDIMIIADAESNTQRALSRFCSHIRIPTLCTSTRDELWNLITNNRVCGAIVRDPLHAQDLGPEFFGDWRNHEVTLQQQPAFIIANIRRTHDFYTQMQSLLESGVNDVISYEEPAGNSALPVKLAITEMVKHMIEISQQ